MRTNNLPPTQDENHSNADQKVDGLQVLNTPKQSSPYSDETVNSFKDEYIVPHFHGVNFVDAGVKAIERQEFFETFKAGGAPYYSEAILRNGYTDYVKALSYWRQRLLDDFFSNDMENLREALSEDTFYEFQQQYVNMYKSCYGAAEKKFLKDPKNIFKQAEEILQDNNQLRDTSLYSLKVKSDIEEITAKRQQISNELALVKGKKNTEDKTKRGQLQIELAQINYQESKLMNDFGFDPFIAMSKLPRHATMFALSPSSFSNSHGAINTRRDGFTFLGFVMCSFHTIKQYNDSVQHDTLAAAREGKEALNAHYKNQAEVDFHRLEQGILEFSTPVLIIKPGNSQDKKDSIKQQFNLTDEEYKQIVNCLFFKNNSIKTEKTGYENLVSHFSEKILTQAKTQATEQRKDLVYITPGRKVEKFESGVDIKGIQRRLIDDSEFQVTQEEEANWQSNTPTNQDQNNNVQLQEHNKEVGEAIINSFLNSDTATDARQQLSQDDEYLSMELYETACVDRITNLENKTDPRDRRDEKLAQVLQDQEDQRVESFKNREFIRLSKMFDAVDITQTPH